MEHYFEVTYPKRLQALKEELEPLAEVIFNHRENFQNAAIPLMQFAKKVHTFLENTKLHLTSSTVIPNEKYINHVNIEHIMAALGNSKAAVVFQSMVK